MYTKRHISAYAVAIFDLVREEHNFEVIQKEFEFLLEVLNQHPELLEYLKNDLVPEAERNHTIDLVLEGHNWILNNTVKVVLQRRMIRHLKKIIIEYLKLSNRELRIRFLRVISAFPLSDEQMEAIKEKMQKDTRRTIELKNVVDPSLISGIRIESRTEVLELNYKHDLEKIKKIILKKEKEKGV